MNSNLNVIGEIIAMAAFIVREATLTMELNSNLTGVSIKDDLLEIPSSRLKKSADDGGPQVLGRYVNSLVHRVIPTTNIFTQCPTLNCST